VPINITMPAFSPTMEEGKLVRWLVKSGDRVAVGDVIAQIETDKALMELESADNGTIVQLLAPEGAEKVKVDAAIAVLEIDSDLAAASVGAGSGSTIVRDAATVASTAVSIEVGQVAKRNAAAVATIAGAGRRPDRPGFASPRARKLARQSGVDVTSIAGSGPRGRIVAADVEAAIAPAKALLAATDEEAPPLEAVANDQVLQPLARDSYELAAHGGMRKTIARRLVEAKTTIPHFYMSIDCEIDALLTLRDQLNETITMRKTEKSEGQAYRLSVNDMIVKAFAQALAEVPDANVSWTEENMVRHRNVDVGVAVSIAGGLITPIVRNAESKTLRAISNELKTLIALARDRKLRPEDYQGGTTSISNLGMFGVREFAAVINPPHATILAVGAGSDRAVVSDGAIRIAKVMTVTLSIDHRAVDGAVGAKLLAAFRCRIEKPIRLVE
jgi:pyruvate dehydrogenase E2 component (dihydrolipoamide acetyltransferase)